MLRIAGKIMIICISVMMLVQVELSCPDKHKLFIRALYFNLGLMAASLAYSIAKYF